MYIRYLFIYCFINLDMQNTEKKNMKVMILLFNKNKITKSKMKVRTLLCIKNKIITSRMRIQKQDIIKRIPIRYLLRTRKKFFFLYEKEVEFVLETSVNIRLGRINAFATGWHASWPNSHSQVFITPNYSKQINRYSCLWSTLLYLTKYFFLYSQYYCVSI